MDKKWRERINTLEEIAAYNIYSIKYMIQIGIKWILFATLTGAVVGLFSSTFAKCLHDVTAVRLAHPQIIYCLPLGGLIIVFMYSVFGMQKDPGTNVLLAAVHKRDKDVPILLAPAIFFATVTTHLFGGSAGREGAALQMGGSLGNSIGRLFKLNDRDRKVLVMSGMSAAFSAVFGTPLAAAIFPMEMISVGIIQYSALLPCVFSAFVAGQFASSMGISPESFIIQYIPVTNIPDTGKVVLLGIGCAVISVLFVAILRIVGEIYGRTIQNPYLRVIVGGFIMMGCVYLLGSMDFCGAGTGLIEEAIHGETHWYTFLLKMLLTAITLGAGYKGGEIVPAFTAGATFGCLFGQLVGLSPSMCAAIGMIAVFCGVTNCPISSMLIGFELFGFKAAGYFLIAIAVTFLFSGYKGLYKEQLIVYSKYTPKYINRFSGEDYFDEDAVGQDYDD